MPHTSCTSENGCSFCGKDYRTLSLKTLGLKRTKHLKVHGSIPNRFNFDFNTDLLVGPLTAD